CFTSVIYNPNMMLIGVWAIGLLMSNQKEKSKLFKIENNTVIRLLRGLLFSLGVFGAILFINKSLSHMNFKNKTDEVERVSKNISGTKILNDYKSVKENPHIEFRIGYELFIDGHKRKGLYMMNNAVNKTNITDFNFALSVAYEYMQEYHNTETLLKRNTGI